MGTAGCVTVPGRDPAVMVTEGGTLQLEFVEWNEGTSELLRSAVPEPLPELFACCPLSLPAMFTRPWPRAIDTIRNSSRGKE